MRKKKKVLFINSLFTSFLLILGVFIFIACDKTSAGEDSKLPTPESGAVLVDLSIKSVPLKTDYFIGEDFSSVGLLVEAKYDNGTFFPIQTDRLVFSGFTSEKSNPQLFVKISFNGLSVEQKVKIHPFKVKDGAELTEYVEDESSVIIPEGIVRIAADVFYGKSMTNIDFPETLQEIGEYAFFSCYNLENVQLPSSLKKVGEGVFDNCKSLSSADLSKSALTGVGGYMFSRCPVLSNVKLPPGVLSIGSLAFFKAASLKSIVLPENMRFIGLDAFRESGLERISLPNNMKVIRQRAFFGCSSLTEVTTYGDYIFSDDEYVPLLEAYSFENIPALTKFEIPLGTTVLGQTILSDCPLLEEIKIPETVTEIGFNAFGNTQLKRVVMGAGTPPVAVPATGTTAWNAFPSTVAVEVPVTAVDSYKQAFGWSKYAIAIKGY